MTKIEHSGNESIGCNLTTTAICDLVYQHHYPSIDELIFTYSSTAFGITVHSENDFLVAIFRCKAKQDDCNTIPQ